MIYTNHNDWLDQEKGVLRDGNSDEDIFVSTARIRYKFWLRFLALVKSDFRPLSAATHPKVT